MFTQRTAGWWMLARPLSFAWTNDFPYFGQESRAKQRIGVVWGMCRVLYACGVCVCVQRVCLLAHRYSLSCDSCYVHSIATITCFMCFRCMVYCFRKANCSFTLKLLRMRTAPLTSNSFMIPTVFGSFISFVFKLRVVVLSQCEMEKQ